MNAVIDRQFCLHMAQRVCHVFTVAMCDQFSILILLDGMD
jgi:hypothetical protein